MLVHRSRFRLLTQLKLLFTLLMLQFSLRCQQVYQLSLKRGCVYRNLFSITGHRYSSGYILSFCKVSQAFRGIRLGSICKPFHAGIQRQEVQRLYRQLGRRVRLPGRSYIVRTLSQYLAFRGDQSSQQNRPL